jgi:hypothetical protein
MNENQRKSIWLRATAGTRLTAVLAGLPYLLYALEKYVPGLSLNTNPGPVDNPAAWLFQILRGFPPTWWLLTRLARADYWTAQRALVEARQWAFALCVLVMGQIAWLARRDPLGGLLSVLPFYPIFAWWTGMDRGKGDYILDYSLLPPPAPGEVLRTGLGEFLTFAVVCLPPWLTLAWGQDRRRTAAA